LVCSAAFFITTLIIRIAPLVLFAMQAFKRHSPISARR
jgi:hypothetical protein